MLFHIDETLIPNYLKDVFKETKISFGDRNVQVKIKRKKCDSEGDCKVSVIVDAFINKYNFDNSVLI